MGIAFSLKHFTAKAQRRQDAKKTKSKRKEVFRVVEVITFHYPVFSFCASAPLRLGGNIG
jgi:hypothetical protein